MIRTLLFCGLLYLNCGLWADEMKSDTMTRNQIREYLEKTKTLYASEDKKDIAEAAKQFQTVLDQAPKGEMNPEALKLAEGMSQLKAGEPEAALKTLEEISGFEDPQVRGRVRQMKGNAQLQLSEQALAKKDWKNAKEYIHGAIESFSNALRENPEMAAAQNNLELSNKQLQKIIKMEPPPPPENQKKQDQDKKQDPQDQQKKQDQKDQQGQQKQDQQKQDQKKQDQKKQDQSDQTDQSDQQKKQDQTDQKEQKKQKDQADKKENAAPSESAGQPTEAEKLDAKKAKQILDAALEQEKRQRAQIIKQKVRAIPVDKDW